MKNEIGKKILIIVATHGDETFSLPVIEKLKKQFPDKFDFIIGNPRALKQNKRFTEKDLNRVAPGKSKSKIYEERRVFEILKKSKDYLFTIDIHGTSSETGIFTIVTNATPSNMLLAYLLPIQKIVIWDNGKSLGPLSRFVSCGVSIECGSKSNPKIANELYEYLKFFLNSREISGEINSKELYQVFGKIEESDLDKKEKGNLKDFIETKINNQKVYPLLVNNSYKGIVCYKLKKINFCKKFRLSY